MAELAPRDIVSRVIYQELARTGDTNVFLDVRHLGRQWLAQRFPTISKLCASFDINVDTDLIPVRPSAHYMIGGVRVDAFGRTSLSGLYACGEVSSTGLHGANRLGSNSLLEGLVFGRVIGRIIAEDLGPAAAEPRVNGPAAPHRIDSNVTRSTRGELHLPDVRDSLRALMWRNAGIERNGDDLAEAEGLIGFWQSYVLDKVFEDPHGWELQNMLTMGRLMTEAALSRTETRGVHCRSDHPDRDDDRWACHILMGREREPWFEPVEGGPSDGDG